VAPAGEGTGVIATPSVSLHVLTARWRSAFHAADAALHAAAGSLPPEELRAHGSRLTAELAPTQSLLEALAHDRHADGAFLSLAVSPLKARRLLGLPDDVAGCVFNLDGVLIGSASLHAAAWAETFDELLSARVERTGGHFPPFNPRLDYPQHLHARPRLDGVRSFLASRGIRLPEGTPSDPPGAETVHGLANRKKAALLRRLDEHGVAAFDGSRRYLELAHDAGLPCAVVSASANTATILDRAGLADLVDERVDGETIRAEGLRVKPAADTLLAACRKLGIAPTHAVAFETTRAGVAAGRAAGFALVVGVDGGSEAAGLRAEGADLVVAGVAELLERTAA
jgi:HAD superfamily hydrolase (TIGR01509 family)